MTDRTVEVRVGTGPPPTEDELRVVPWRDPLVEPIGIDPRSSYVEHFWLPVLGPSATWLLRRLVGGLESSPDGYSCSMADTAAALGLGSTNGRSSAIRRTIGRCVRFDVARYGGVGTLAVRRLVTPLPRHHLLRLPVALQEQHRSWESGRPWQAALGTANRRARPSALDLTELGERPEAASCVGGQSDP